MLKAQAIAESLLKPDVESPVHAKGIAQFLQATFDEWAKKCNIENPDIYNPEHNIHCQAAYMAWLLKHYNNVEELALAAYNWGVGNVQKHIFPENEAGYEYKKLDFYNNIEKFPKETRNYVGKIFNIMLA